MLSEYALDKDSIMPLFAPATLPTWQQMLLKPQQQKKTKTASAMNCSVLAL
jgi:hypothetical protein